MFRRETPMKRQSDGKIVGTLTVARVNDWSFVHEDGTRRVNPARVDSVVINITNTTGETVGYASIPLADITAD